MKFECGDLDRALETPELMPEAREHLKTCTACRREYRLWNEISAAARELHEEWDTPALWPSIRQRLEGQIALERRPSWYQRWPAWAAAAILVLASTLGILAIRRLNPSGVQPGAAASSAAGGANRDFLTEQALAEVERTEAAYRQSISKLDQLARPELKNRRNATAVNCTEKLELIDSAIAETRTNLDHNRFNMHLQTELADLYREKKETLQELLSRDRKN